MPKNFIIAPVGMVHPRKSWKSKIVRRLFPGGRAITVGGTSSGKVTFFITALDGEAITQFDINPVLVTGLVDQINEALAQIRLAHE